MLFNGILPPEAVGNESRLILCGDRSLLIEGHKGLLSYDSACIKAKLPHALLICQGSDLVISEFSGDAMLISGEIHFLELKR